MSASAASAAAAPRRRLVIFANPEKKGHGASSDPFIPDTPFRMALVGPPGAGKRSQLLNILAELEDTPTRIIAIHGDPDTKEYEGITDDVRGPDDVPNIDDMMGKDQKDRDKHKLVIVDEIPWGNLSKVTMTKFERLMNHVSTHSTTSIMLCFQQLVGIKPAVRRAMDHFILFKNVDLPATDGLAARVGMSTEAIREIMGSGGRKQSVTGNATGIIRDQHDSLWIDLTASPEDAHRLRLNLWTPILPRGD